jgi:hypothetical protein
MEGRGRRYTKVLVIGVVLLTLFTAAPFLSVFLGNNIRDFIFRELCYRVLYDRITERCLDDACVAQAVFTFASEHIAVPSPADETKDLSPLEVIAEGHGWCDQQANVMITLAGLGGIDGNLLFLYGYDSISHHSVCELEVDGRFLLFDPFYRASFRTKRGERAGLNDLLAGDHDPAPITGAVPDDYFRLFEETYPAKRYLSNRVSSFKRLSRWLIKLYCQGPTKHLIKPYVKAYAVMDAPSTVDMDGIDRILAMP